MQAIAAFGMTYEHFMKLAGNPEWANEGELSKAHIIAWYRYHTRLLDLRGGF